MHDEAVDKKQPRQEKVLDCGLWGQGRVARLGEHVCLGTTWPSRERKEVPSTDIGETARESGVCTEERARVYGGKPGRKSCEVQREAPALVAALCSLNVRSSAFTLNNPGM